MAKRPVGSNSRHGDERTGGGLRPQRARHGVIAGYLLKAIRQSLGLPRKLSRNASRWTRTPSRDGRAAGAH